MATLDKLVVELQLEATQMKAQLQAAEGQLKRLSGAVGSANSPVNKLQGSFKQLGSTMTSVLAGAAMINFLKKSAEAAAADAKSQVVLATALKNTTGATTEQVAAIDQQLSKISMLTNVADDNLRPALAILSRTTGDSTKSMDLLNLALDVSAGTGKDVSQVALILSRAYSGNLTALNKLLPGIKNSTDWMGQLRDTFKGNAEAAANTDPLTKMNVIMGELMETVGKLLLPALTDFANWFMSVQPLIEALLPIVGGIAAAFVTWKVASFALQAAMLLYNGVMALSTIATEGFTIALASTGIGAIAIAVGVLTAGLIALNQQMDTAATDRTARITNESGVTTDINLSEIHRRAKTYAETKANRAMDIYRQRISEMDRQEQLDFEATVPGGSFGVARQTIYDQQYKQRYAQLVAEAKKKARNALPAGYEAPPPPPAPKDDTLSKYLARTQTQITDLQKKYQTDSLNLIEEYQTSLTQRIADFKSTFASATQIDLAEMYTAGAKSGEALVEGMRSKLQGIKDFSENIANLTAAGFSSDFTQQIAAAGPIMGSEMAQAILNSTPEVQAELQSLFKQTQEASAHGVDFISDSITGEFKVAADQLATALTDLATTLNESLKAIGAKLNTKLLTKTSAQLKENATDIAQTRNILGSSYAKGVPAFYAPKAINAANESAANTNGIISNFQINTTATTEASPETITQTIVNGIKFGLPTLVGATN
jgi:hypothetical protein